MIGNKISNRITIFKKNLQQNNSETVTNENDQEIPKEIPKERYIYIYIYIYIQKNNKKLLVICDQYNSIIMEYQKMINLLDNTPNRPTKLKTKNWIEINDDARRTYVINVQIKFKTSMLKSRLCDYSDAYILVIGTIKFTVEEDIEAAKKADERN